MWKSNGCWETETKGSQSCSQPDQRHTVSTFGLVFWIFFLAHPVSKSPRGLRAGVYTHSPWCFAGTGYHGFLGQTHFLNIHIRWTEAKVVAPGLAPNFTHWNLPITCCVIIISHWLNGELQGITQSGPFTLTAPTDDATNENPSSITESISCITDLGIRYEIHLLSCQHL